MKALQTFVAGLGKVGTSISCRIDAPDLQNVPRQGPLILAVNHINSLEVPLLVAHLAPRRIIGLAKTETWDDPIMGWLFDLFEAVPIRRGEVDLGAIHRCLVALSEREILAMAPEGTRSYDGKLQEGQPGIVLLALHSGAPILPLVHWGGEWFSRNIKRAVRTDFHIRLGRPFRLEAHGEKPVGKVRKAMTEEVMVQMAGLMPVEYRGMYSDLISKQPKYIEFL